MGAQIAAHLANAGIEVVLFDLPSEGKDKSDTVRKSIQGLKKLSPAPLASKDAIKYVDAANYEQDLPQLGHCDLIIEAIAERKDWKHDLYKKIAPYLQADTILASNTSGISINALAEGLPEGIRSRFCGIHFFNPPRYMHLVELIATKDTDANMLDALESWLTSRLGKGVVRALDTPNFVANRVGVFSILAVMHHTLAFKLGFDEADALTGPKIGRPKSATFRTADVVGLDTMMHVINTMASGLPNDPWHAHFKAPSWLSELIKMGALGQKTKAGIFRKQGKDIQVLDPALKDYRASNATVSDEVAAILKNRSSAERFAALRASSHPQAQFLWSIFRDVFHYAAFHLESIADNARDLDLAMRWGFGWTQGPFETWQASDWKAIAQAIADDIANGKTMCSAPLPQWVFDGREGVHKPEGSWSARKATYLAPSTLPVYERQLFPEPLVGSDRLDPAKAGETLYQNEGVRLWTLPSVDKGVGILSIISKNHALGEEVLDGIQAAVAHAEKALDAVVIWHDAPFAVGANLKQIVEACGKGDFDRLDHTIAKFQQTSQVLKYSQVPVVAAVQGLALGGGCEFVMHADKRVLALESHIGLVEAGVGLIPAGGGSKEFAIRASQWAAQSATPNELVPFLQPIFMNIATAKVSGSAQEAVELGYARTTDTVLFNHKELLYVGIKEARNLAEAGYAPPLMAKSIPVAGRTGIAALELTLANMLEGNMISKHDYRVARAAAVALCGGEIEAGSLVDETWLLNVERSEFLNLLKSSETQARILHMLETGKPLRN